ncbi:MAG: hypothetical protein UX99_C0001G0034 [Candidatus Amesbacteria bacterium GW2011_GWB1_47_26]|nr:MAG: hypothetical protein UX52_C0006G0024 [Candidatus Amesbacteria bacterium GW2011_GWA1_46_35]KKU75184.1 MAG: hypothetical protein UX99_C0001G0034 [Candidatus Amesbacteria bacterium GW2011_GWB1_47_26]
MSQKIIKYTYSFFAISMAISSALLLIDKQAKAQLLAQISFAAILVLLLVYLIILIQK